MEQYVGLDVSQAETAVCVIDAQGKRQWQGICRSMPQVIAQVLEQRAPFGLKVAMETGPLAVWLWHTEIRKLDRVIIKTAAGSPICRRLMTIPGVGPTTAVAYLATIDQPGALPNPETSDPIWG